jgi:hypothetical protein
MFLPCAIRSILYNPSYLFNIVEIEMAARQRFGSRLFKRFGRDCHLALRLALF